MMGNMTNKIELISDKVPSGDQPKAIKELLDNFKFGVKKQVLLGATGTGKTFTVANIISSLNSKTIVLAPNKTLAAQLYSELKALFPKNRVEYFVSYFDFYQPEAYVASKNMYVEKTSKTNQEIEMLRVSTLNSLTSREDVIVVASVASIYASVSAEEFENSRVLVEVGLKFGLKKLKRELVTLNYERNDLNLKPGCFRSKGDVIEICPGHTDLFLYRISFFEDEIEEIAQIESLTKNVMDKMKLLWIPPAVEYVSDRKNLTLAIHNIEKELEERISFFKKNNQLIEAQRIEERTKHDLESILELGFCSGIENYSRHLELRKEGQTPHTIFDFMGKDFLLVLDECHLMIPQVRGMYNTDLSRKQSLVNYGFRLPSALDNRPLNYDEFYKMQDRVIYVSATPNEYEIIDSNNIVVEQIVRPTSLLDPIIILKKTDDQINEIVKIIKENIKNNERTLITVLTIKMSEELTNYLTKNKIKALYLHSDIKTLERVTILNELRRGVIDVVVGINLLREGLDLPEVSTVIIVDADKPGFFRSEKSLVQLIGRASRNIKGRVFMFGDLITPAMAYAIKETDRRRKIQEDYNTKHGLVPRQIVKPIDQEISKLSLNIIDQSKIKKEFKAVSKNKKQLLINLKIQMKSASKKQEYERAAYLRDMIIEIENS